jgi:8-oxo-dGTP pyrophosphatase MutT (NUDIX family)
MAPAYRTDASFVSIDGKDCREAGVLALLFPLDADPSIVLTVRRDHLPDHAGQISFPGGQRENGEALRETALREAQEEVNLDPMRVDVLGALTPLYIPPSNFCVHPFVGAAFEPPGLRPTDEEVGTILRVPLSDLLAPSALQREIWTLHGQSVEVPFFNVQGHKVWGATAMMLAEFLALCADAFSASL